MALTPPVSGSDHIWGSATALFELVEYGDFQCPYCGRAYPLIKQLKESMNGSMKFIFRNFPLSRIHPQAKSAAIAAEAAALQGRFWEMHDILFEQQKRLNQSSLFEYASSAGLDVARYTKDIMQKGISEKVDNDFMNGLRSGVNGTPTFFINGVRYNGLWEGGELNTYLQQHFSLVK